MYSATYSQCNNCHYNYYTTTHLLQLLFTAMCATINCTTCADTTFMPVFEERPEVHTNNHGRLLKKTVLFGKRVVGAGQVFVVII
jgi:hypothetical protein